MEEIHYLIPEKLMIIQDSNYFKFGTDSVFLVDFTNLKKGDRVIDLGSGSGVIPLLLAFKQKPGRVTGIELQPGLVEMSRRSVRINGMEDIIDIVEGDLKEAAGYIEPGSVDVVITNPPYMPANSGKITLNQNKAIARHEIKAGLEDVVRAASILLRFGGRLTMVHRPMRLAEIMASMRRFNIEPKRLRMVQPRLHCGPNMVLIEGRKGGRSGLEVEPVLVVYRGHSQEYTDTVKEIYGADNYD